MTTASSLSPERPAGTVRSFRDRQFQLREEAILDAAATLAQSIQNGSKGKYGRIPMPPHASLGQADLKLLSAWVLTRPPAPDWRGTGVR